eukprot:TRINITY_DN2829_c0_g1_i1.p1 TRINITY_DN2829_c0_g1~~TRINITY_DN2829_c0_g1_i1.p1  ORF type:complete len:132 (-),score=22.23 TRINITY_DN2829_c0_g1_i1:1077-1472(-)
MYIEEFKEGGLEGEEQEEPFLHVYRNGMRRLNANSVLVGVGARVLFYPTLLYNVVRNKIQSEFRWWDEVDKSHGIDHLVIPTRDYLFAPSYGDIHQAVEFIHKNASCGKMTYVTVKLVGGRSTTIVLCYLV